MNKLMTISLASVILLSGCSLYVAKAKSNEIEHRPVPMAKMDRDFLHRSNELHKLREFEPEAVISVSKITYASTSAILSTVDRKEDFSAIEYQLWRTADSPTTRKIFTSNLKSKNYSFLFNTKEFDGKRGEYQIEAYGVREDGSKEILAKSAVTFQQYVPILMYHAIDDYQGDGIKELFVTPANFEAQMSYLKENGYTLLTFEQWDMINKVNKPIFVTFDDGMKNNLNAFRILQKLKDEHFLPRATEYVIANYVDSGPSQLSTEDIKEMVDSDIFSIQSHTMTHADLPKISNFVEEFKTAKEKIEQITGKPVIAIAYPYGHYDEKVVAEAKKYYQFATTTKPGKFIEKDEPNELLLIHRVRISYSTTLKQFAAIE